VDLSAGLDRTIDWFVQARKQPTMESIALAGSAISA
jgi:hypothetical protein